MTSLTSQNSCPVLEKNFLPPDDELFPEVVSDIDYRLEAEANVIGGELPIGIDYADPDIVALRESIAEERDLLSGDEAGLDPETQDEALKSLDRMEIDALHGRAATRLMGAKHAGGLGCASCITKPNCPINSFLGDIEAIGEESEVQIAKSRMPLEQEKISMSEFPMMTSREVKHLLENAGFQCIRKGSGSHFIMHNVESGATFPIPAGHRGDIGKILLQAIISQTGLTRAEFLSFR